MDPITIPNISIPTISIPTIGIPSVGFPSASGGGGLSWPAGMKEHIKAIYDPASQGMTNYDVIEAYVENFTTWNYLSSRGSATVTTNKIIITKSFSNTQNIIEDNKSPYDDIKIYVTGISEDNPLTINQYVDNKWVRLHTYTTDGIYIVKNRNLYVGFGTYITDDCNITITQLPTSILKDLSGNGNHAYLYGGKGKLNSGIGVYAVDFTTYNGGYEKEPSVAKLTKEKRQITKPYGNIDGDIEPYIVKIEGINTGYINYNYRRENGKEYAYSIQKDGVYTLPKCYKEGTTGSNNSFVLYEETDDAIITITQIPDYPDQLCYDGKMYAVCYGFPILEDYTVMADRTWFEKQNGAFISKSNNPGQGAFIFENILSGAQNTYSFAQPNSISIQDGISYQTKNSYNGSSLSVGTGFDNPNLVIGRMRDTSEVYYVGCHGKIIISDRSFTEDEITWLKDNWEKI